MPRNLIVLLGLTIAVLLLSGCAEEEHKTKTGIIEWSRSYDIGGTFSDLETVIVYNDGSKLYLVCYDTPEKLIYDIETTITYRTSEYEGQKYNSFVEIKIN
jgi:hypothetical protein